MPLPRRVRRSMAPHERRPRRSARSATCASSRMPRAASHAVSSVTIDSRIAHPRGGRCSAAPRRTATPTRRAGSRAACAAARGARRRERRAAAADSPTPSCAGVFTCRMRPLLHERHAVAARRLVHVRRGHDDREPAAAQPAEQVPELHARDGVHAGRRLVEHEELAVRARARSRARASASCRRTARRRDDRGTARAAARSVR